MNCDRKLYANQKNLGDGTFATKFICVHDAQMEGAFATVDDIFNCCLNREQSNFSEEYNNLEVSVSPLYKNQDGKINIFILTIYYIKPIDDLYNMEDIIWTGFTNLDYVYNYSINPIDTLQQV